MKVVGRIASRTKQFIHDFYTWPQILQSLKRKKSASTNEESKLAKVLTTFDLTALGVGSTLGVGIYVLAGQVSKNTAGPAVVISFFIAAVASMFSGLCYAEFGARVPKAGSAYVYSYVTVGEFVAFIIGWNLLLEYVIGTASVVKGLFTYLDSLMEHVMSEFFREHIPMNVSFLGPFPDFFSFGVTIIFSLGIAFGAKESSLLNTVFTFVNLGVVLFVVISGFWKIDIANWQVPEEVAVEAGYGTGGFAPYGFNGIIKGAAQCFYGFIGFDCIATAGEEAKDPRRSIPIAVVASLLIVFLAYFGISSILTLMLPYYLQDAKSPFPHVYDVVDWPVPKWIVSVGAVFGLLASLLGAMFPLPRIIYAMSIDGMLFEVMGRISSRFKTPVFGTLCAGVFTACLAAIFDMEDLIEMMSIGTFLAYSMVCACVLILRYSEDLPLDPNSEQFTMKKCLGQMFNRKLKTPNGLSSTLVILGVVFYVIFAIIFAGCASIFESDVFSGEAWAVSVMAVSGVVIIIIVAAIVCQPRSQMELAFSVPLVPYLPLLSILINIYLMTTLDYKTWIRFAVWIAVGLVLYFFYGIRYSKEKYQTFGNQAQKIAVPDENVIEKCQ